MSSEELLHEFQLFRAAAEDLEAAYADLKGRAERIDKQLAEKNEQLLTALDEREQILQALPLGVFLQSEKGLLAQNDAAQKLSLLLGDGLSALAMSHDEEDGSIQCVVLDKSGTKRVLRKARVQLQQRGESLLFIDDQTTLARLHEEVERIDRIKSLAELSLGIAHEIRNPMNGILGFACMMRKDPSSPKLARWALRVEEGVRRVDKIIKDLLAFARPEQRRAMVRKRLDAWLVEASAAELGIEIELSGDAGQTILVGHEEALGKVFSNLARNSEEAGASKITIAVESIDKGRIRLCFTDDGPGIDPAIAGKLFDPFVGTKESGSGLGLAFCARALEAMGAGIHSQPKNGGALLVLDFPSGQD